MTLHAKTELPTFGISAVCKHQNMHFLSIRLSSDEVLNVVSQDRCKMFPFRLREKARERSLDVFATLPEDLRRPNCLSEHSINQKRGRPLDSFLEGPLVVGDILYLTDTPYGRIIQLKISTRQWSVLAEYDGEPNGLAWHSRLQKIIIADFKNGILGFDPSSGKITTVLSRFNGERFRGPNDLIVSSDGSIFFTDQGMSGLQNPCGRVYRLHMDGKVDVLLHNCPSPNGLVLNGAETTLFVAMTRDNSVWHVPIYPDGSAQRTGRFTFYYGTGGHDGLLLDKSDNLFVAHSSLGSVFVHRASGEPLVVFRTCRGSAITNLTWEDASHTAILVVESESGSILRSQWKALDVGT